MCTMAIADRCSNSEEPTTNPCLGISNKQLKWNKQENEYDINIIEPLFLRVNISKRNYFPIHNKRGPFNNKIT